MAQALVSASLCYSLRDVRAVNPFSAGVLPRLPLANISGTATSFARGSPLLSRTLNQIKPACKAASISIRCEQGTKGGSGGLDVWLGRFAMIGFTVAITVEIVTGKGLLENFGLTSPLPTLALAVTALVGILTAVFIIQSASED
ncbi:stress enhanced protein 1, chloroplastic isoform X2 [Macadamia integrifolia]|uniref:stress enhanced protein 1, chloroplastic isoform X2 n=1 Tax=Macadamia integrifolia TaxID=60698 RepID=UPI001C4EBE47|nr:stress enhanced protein 1, chloroplastic isoform X2 [Macadamia integrifolia]